MFLPVTLPADIEINHIKGLRVGEKTPHKPDEASSEECGRNPRQSEHMPNVIWPC